MQPGAHAFARTAVRPACPKALARGKESVATATAGAFRGLPRQRRGSSRRIPLPRDPAGEQKEMHRVGVAFVQLTRSTFAEATAGRECLQPPALRARCNWKDSARFRIRQARPHVILSQIATIIIPVGDRRLERSRDTHSTTKCTEPGAPSSDSRPTAAEATACRRAINLRRSFLGAHGTLRSGQRVVKWEPIAKLALCVLFFSHSKNLRLDACALERKGP